MRPGEYYNPAPYAEELPVIAQDAPATSRPAPLDASAFGPTWAALKDYFRPPQYSARDLESVSSPNRDVPAEPLSPPVASPSYISTAQPAPSALPSNFNGSPAPVISQAVSQLNAGQPVTALPHQDWSLQQATAFNAKLDAFDQQAKHARIAADQAARDAHLFDQMSRVAKSTKDIEIALQQQDVMGFRNAVASGTPGYQALQRFPRAATSPLVAAMHAAQPVAPPTFGKSPGGAEYMQDAHGVHFTPRTGALPDAAVKTLPDGTRIIQVSPEKWQVLDKGAAKPGTLDAAARTEIGLLKSEKAALDKEMASGAWLAKSAVPEFKAQQDAANQRLAFITKRLGELLPGAYPTAAPAGKSTLTREQAAEFLRQSKGDKEKARKLARDAGLTF